MKYGEISIDPEVMSGALVFAGTGVHIQTLFDYIEGGEDLGEFLDDFPSVSKESALAVLEMAKKTLTSEKLLHENFALVNLYQDETHAHKSLTGLSHTITSA